MSSCPNLSHEKFSINIFPPQTAARSIKGESEGHRKLLWKKKWNIGEWRKRKTSQGERSNEAFLLIPFFANILPLFLSSQFVTVHRLVLLFYVTRLTLSYFFLFFFDPYCPFISLSQPLLTRLTKRRWGDLKVLTETLRNKSKIDKSTVILCDRS